jgi:hypothetical protein
LVAGRCTLIAVIAAILTGALGFEEGLDLRRQARRGAEQQRSHAEKVGQESQGSPHGSSITGG